MTSLDQLIEDARKLIQRPTDLEQLTEAARDLLGEKSFRVGTVRRWGGVEFQKQPNKTWSKVKGQFKNRSAQGGLASVPVTNFPKRAVPSAAKKAPSAPPAAHHAPAKAPAKAPEKTPEKATADSLPDDPFKYFTKPEGAQLVPVSALKTIRARPEGIKNAATHMANAFNGDGAKRKPISLKDNGDGTYTVMDGNSTTAMAQQHKWKHIVAIVDPPDKPGERPAASADHGHPAPPTDPADVPGLKAAVDAGKLAPGKTVEEHVKIAEKFLAKHSANLSKSIATLQNHMPEGTKVKGRVKELHSALGKLVRKPKYKTADKLQDGTGMRVIAQDSATLDRSIAALKKNYKIVAEDDYVSNPLGGKEGLGYRSYHAVIEDDDGLEKEVQLRTPNQNTHADWCHDVYKPVSPHQEEAMKKHADEIAKYAREMGDFFEKVDKADKPGEAPPCPPPVKLYFTCL